MRFLIVLLIALGFYESKAQNGTLQVLVTDGKSPLSEVKVSVSDRDMGLTDVQGTFKCNLTPGTYNVRFSLIGYAHESIDGVLIKYDELTEVKVQLRPSNIQLDELEVTEAPIFSYARLGESDELRVLAARKQEVVKMANIDANLVTNVSRQIFARTPGVMVWENDPSGIQINVASRGLSPNRNWEYNTRQNGYDIASDPVGYPEAYYAPPMEAVESIELIRGGASLQYGSQFGGLLNFKLRRASGKPIEIVSNQTVGSYGLFNSYNQISGTKGRFSYFGYYNNRSGSGWRDNSAFTAQHAHLRLGYQVHKNWSIEAEVSRQAYESQQAAGLADSLFALDPSQSHRNRNWFGAPATIASTTLKWKPNARATVSLNVFGLLGERNSVGFVRPINVLDTINLILGSYNPRQVDRDAYRNIGAELRGQQTYLVANREQVLSYGMRYFNGQTNRQQLGAGSTGRDFDLTLVNGFFARDLNFEAEQFSAFAEHMFRFGRRWAVVPGLRFERINNTGSGRINLGADQTPLLMPNTSRQRQFVLGAFGVEYHISPKIESYANISQAYRPITFAEITPSATTDVIDEELRDASGYKSEWGFRGTVQDWLTFDYSVYFMQYQNRIGTIAMYNADSSTYQFRTNIGTANSRGIESYTEVNWTNLLKMPANWGKISTFVALSWNDARIVDQKTTSVSNGQISVGNLENNRLEYAPTYLHRYGISYLNKGFSLSLQGSAVGAVYTDATNTVKPNAAATVGLIPAYQVFDLSCKYLFKQRYTFNAGVNNISNALYATRRAGGYPGPGLMPADPRTAYVGVGIRL
jgi:Fe(3+) dicitrate transport protein